MMGTPPGKIGPFNVRFMKGQTRPTDAHTILFFMTSSLNVVVSAGPLIIFYARKL